MKKINKIDLILPIAIIVLMIGAWTFTINEIEVIERYEAETG